MSVAIFPRAGRGGAGDGRRIFNNQETYGFPDHDQIFARLDTLREQVR